MIIPIKYASVKHNNNAAGSYVKQDRTCQSPVSMPVCDTVSFCGKPPVAKQSVKFLIPLILGSLGITQFMPDVLLTKIFDIELEDFKHELFRLYGTSKSKEIKSYISEMKQMAEEHPDKLKIVENLLRKSVFNPIESINYLTPEQPELFDKQLEFLTKMVKNKRFVRHVDASDVQNRKTGKVYTIEDFEAKEKMLAYLEEFNKRYEASDRWNWDKQYADAWSVGYKQADIINATNKLNLDLMLEIVKTKTTFIDTVSPPDEIKTFDIPLIGYNINEQNIDYVRRMFRDKKVSREAIVGLSEWINEASMTQYKLLNKNKNIPKKFLGEIGAILNDFNYNFVMELSQNPKVPREEIAQIGESYNEHSESVVKYLVKYIGDNRMKDSIREICNIGKSVTKENKEYVEKLCKNAKIPLEVTAKVSYAVNGRNFDLINELGTDRDNYVSEILGCINKVTNKNRKFAETLCFEYHMKAKELAAVMNIVYDLENTSLRFLDVDKKCGILNIHSKYGDLMKECGMDYEKKISEIAHSVRNNIKSMPSENLREFLTQILANNNSEAENVIKTYNFAQFGKNGLPIKYRRKDFVENLEDNILPEIKAEDRHTILEHFGIIDNEDYDGLWNNPEIDKSKLISEKGRAASYKVSEELEKFMLKNSAVSEDNGLNKIINGLIKGIPSFVPLIGKVQHGTHDYSVDIHTLKVLQSCLNNPLYEELSDEGKTILKFSALLHDIGKSGKVRDPNHAEKSAEYAEAILKTISLPKDVKIRIINIIANHHWFADYNTENSLSYNIAALCRNKEDMLIYQILAKADLMNVSKTFHLNVTGTKNDKESSKFFDKQTEAIREALDKIRYNANIVFHTKILSNGNKFPKQKVTLSNGKTLELKVLNFNDLPKDADLEQYGFPKGTTKGNARFLVHMTKTGINFDVAAAMINSHKNDSAWSTSLISAENSGTYGEMPYGFIFDVRQENISEAYYKNTGSGNHKDIKDFEEILFDFDNKERKYVRNNLQKELRKHGIWLNDNEYANLVDYLETKKHITAIKKDVKIGKRTIKAKTLVKCLEKSRDSLFNESYKYGHNEAVVINPAIQGLIAKYRSVNDCNDDFLIFADKYNLPVILIG